MYHTVLYHRGLDDDVVQITKEAVALVNKATEEFIMWLARRSLEVSLYHNKRTLRDVDFEQLLTLRPELFFLRATLLAQPNGPSRQQQEIVYQQAQPNKKRGRSSTGKRNVKKPIGNTQSMKNYGSLTLNNNTNTALSLNETNNAPPPLGKLSAHLAPE